MFVKTRYLNHQATYYRGQKKCETNPFNSVFWKCRMAFLFPACLWFPALGCGNSRWETVHLRQWWIWSSGSKINIQQDAAWEGGCPRGISCGAGKKRTVFVFILKLRRRYSLHSEIRKIIRYNQTKLTWLPFSGVMWSQSHTGAVPWWHGCVGIWRWGLWQIGNWFLYSEILSSGKLMVMKAPIQES